MSLRISAVTQGWLILALVVSCGMCSLTAFWRVVLKMFQSSSVAVVSFDSTMVELRFTAISFRLVQFALAYMGTSYWACFFLRVLTMNWQYGMLWCERPGMTSVLGMSCWQFVKYRSRVLSSQVGSCTNCSRPWSFIKSWKSWWSPG